MNQKVNEAATSHGTAAPSGFFSLDTFAELCDSLRLEPRAKLKELSSLKQLLKALIANLKSLQAVPLTQRVFMS